MADLPEGRLSEMKPCFDHTGVDYLGPLLVRRPHGRSGTRDKVWICLFTCLSESDSFLLALRRFIARRGPPSQMFSDNGTNFVGAERELSEALKEMSRESKVQESLSERQIQWNFIPPKSPHMGGAWERLVRSVKTSLKAILKNQCVHEDTLHTVICEIESIVNSRPLTYVSSDSRDCEPLTPGHFLMNRPQNNVLAPVITNETDIGSRKRWRQAQLLTDHSWKRWRNEYLPTLTVRQRWQREVKNLKEGDVVLLSDKNVPRGEWPLGRIVETCCGRDDSVRVVKVKTASGIFTRPVAQICLLEEA